MGNRALAVVITAFNAPMQPHACRANDFTISKKTNASDHAQLDITNLNISVSTFLKESAIIAEMDAKNALPLVCAHHAYQI